MVNSAFSWDSEVFLSDDSVAEINFWANNVDSLNGRVFIGGRNRYRSELVSPMLPIQPVARLSSPTPNWFFSRIGPLRRNCRVLLGDKLRSFVSPWRPFQVFCPTQGSSGIQTTRTLSLFFSTAAGN